jgi:hypothetical protein
MRDWMERRLPWWALGIWDWPRYRLLSRCWVCSRLMILHTPWALFICERTSLPIEFTVKGEELLRQYALEDARWQIGPAPQAIA